MRADRPLLPVAACLLLLALFATPAWGHGSGDGDGTALLRTSERAVHGLGRR